MQISVALCTYNGARFILEQLNSIAMQTRLPDEVIVCDDCSIDGTLELVSRFAVKAPFKLLYSRNQARLGVTKNFECAILKCTGDIIFLCDQDDFWLPEKLSVMSNYFEIDGRVGLVFSDAIVTDSVLNQFDYTMWKTVKLNKSRQLQLNGDEALSVLVRRYVVTGATLAFRANLREQIMPIPSACFHDAWIACVAATLSRVIAIDTPLILYRQHDSNVIGGRRVGFFSRIIQAINLSPNWFDVEISRSIDLMKKFRMIHGDHVSEMYLNDLAQKIQHLQNRRSIFSANILGGLLLIGGEILSLGYFKFSEGLGAAFIDLFKIKK